MSGSTRGGPPGNNGLRGLDPHHSLSRKLKAMYESVQEEGIPDRFLDLLEKLDQAERMQTPAPANKP